MKSALGWVRRQVGAWMFERRLGVHTSGQVDLALFGLADADRVYYIASHWWNLRRALDRDEVTADDVFLDLGSGMGRMVLEAARFPFRRVIGVELAEDLHRQAEQNVRTYRGRRRCRDVVLVNADVLHYAIPDDVTVVYLFNPFRGRIFASVVDELIRSVDRAPRRVRVLYANPEEHDVLVASGRARPVGEVAVGRRRTNDPADVIRTYEITPSLAATPEKTR